MTGPVPMAVTALDNNEESVCSTVPNDPDPTPPEPEEPMVGAGYNTPTEELLLEPSTNGSVDTEASIAVVISETSSTVKGGLLLEASVRVLAAPETEQPVFMATEDEQATVASLDVPTSEEAMSMAEEPTPGASADKAQTDGEGGWRYLCGRHA